MAHLTRSTRTVTIATGLAVAALLAGCTADGPGAATPSSAAPGATTATSTATPTPTPRALSATDPTAPFDQVEAARWFDGVADDVTTLLGLDSTPPGMTVHLDAETSQNHLVTLKSLAAGDYSFHLACRGGGTLELAVTSGGTASLVIDGPCTGELTSGDFTAAEGGTEFRFTATGDPIDVALHYSPAAP
ncbi:hypothetical protein [Herbiconiux flava]|uniref:Uncharacterized protein n=1 Tax=Herbiconiux flava TaxID=881268 RepID=A0A852STM0_9MICO|nr:hypothetical protein [Herbiconiux flava]NYD72083.1 hypothetical protein [Herbiconiux flava]GLK17953.1 hypothetical protein GCM10017602_24350 [Herbiconiux flava]